MRVLFAACVCLFAAFAISLWSAGDPAGAAVFGWFAVVAAVPFVLLRESR